MEILGTNRFVPKGFELGTTLHELAESVYSFRGNLSWSVCITRPMMGTHSDTILSLVGLPITSMSSLTFQDVSW